SFRADTQPCRVDVVFYIHHERRPVDNTQRLSTLRAVPRWQRWISRRRNPTVGEWARLRDRIAARQTTEAPAAIPSYGLRQPCRVDVVFYIHHGHRPVDNTQRLSTLRAVPRW